MMLADLLDKLIVLANTLAQLVAQSTALIPALARLLRRHRPVTSYESLRLDFVLDIQDPTGQRAILERRQQVRFLTSESGVVRDLVWGDGNPLARYGASGARRLAVQPDGSRRVVLLGLARRPRRGERASIRSRRVITDGLTQPTEYCEALVERPTEHLSIRVLFPRTRPPRDAYLMDSTASTARRIPLRYCADGRPVLRWGTTRPIPEHLYSLRWAW